MTVTIRYKKCKGTGLAKGYGCGELIPVQLYGKPNRVYGLGKSCKCYNNWLITTPEGRGKLKKTTIRASKKVQKEEKQKIRKEKQENNIKNAMKLADTYFSRFIRLAYSEGGKCTCYTCGIIKSIKEIDNGHYMKREHKSTRYDEQNCRPQCKTCNGDIKHNGKQVEFRINLINEIGLIAVENLEWLSKQVKKTSYAFYKENADYYRNLVNDLQKKLGVKYW